VIYSPCFRFSLSSVTCVRVGQRMTVSVSGKPRTSVWQTTALLAIGRSFVKSNLRRSLTSRRCEKLSTLVLMFGFFRILLCCTSVLWRAAEPYKNSHHVCKRINFLGGGGAVCKYRHLFWAARQTLGFLVVFELRATAVFLRRVILWVFTSVSEDDTTIFTSSFTTWRSNWRLTNTTA
jgi:hypothetical protein